MSKINKQKVNEIALNRMAEYMEALIADCPWSMVGVSPWGDCFDGKRTCYQTTTGNAPAVTCGECWKQLVINEAKKEIREQNK